ncbi:MAG: hypothetical protein MK214_15045 [Thalassotalea sp.]|nr:hypothetical protein [Thalassotalea sp.]
MFSTLSGFTGLWSAPATKYLVGAVVVGGAWLYVSSLNNQIEQQQLEIDNKAQQLMAKQAEITSLTVSVEQANHATQAALLEIQSREVLAAQRLTKIAELRDQLTQFELNLTELEHTDEQVKSWADEPVPVAVIRLLNNARDQDSDRGTDTESTATTTAHAGLHIAYRGCEYQPRLSAVDWQALSVYQSVQF